VAACGGGAWPRGSGPSGRASQRAQRTWSPRPLSARVPLVDQWPRVAIAGVQAPGGLRESAGQHFEDRTHQAGAATAGRRRQAEMMAPADSRGDMVVAGGREKAREACNTLGFLEEQRERREGHRSQQIDKEFPRLHCSSRRGKV
jgi:hypothetical protein